MSEQDKGAQKAGEGTPDGDAPAGTKNQNSPAGEDPCTTKT